jgi:hypothetical protein
MSENKTQPTKVSFTDYLASLPDPDQQADAEELAGIMEVATGVKPVMWGPSIVGFGTFHYKYETGREGDTPAVAFSARKSALTLYGLMFYEQNKENVELVNKLGKYTMGKGCVYIKKISDIDKNVLSEMIQNAFKRRSNA